MPTLGSHVAAAHLQICDRHLAQLAGLVVLDASGLLRQLHLLLPLCSLCDGLCQQLAVADRLGIVRLRISRLTAQSQVAAHLLQCKSGMIE